MSMSYRRVDSLLSANASGEVREGDSLLIERGRAPLDGELALVRRGAVELLRRWCGEDDDEVLGVVIGIKRKL